MNYDLIETIVASVGVFVTAVGFYYVSKQLRRSAHSDIYALGLATKQALLEQPHLRSCFFDNADFALEDENDRSRVLVIADMYCLYLEQIALYAEDLGGEKQAWHAYIENMYNKSPVIRESLKEAHYAKALYDVIGIRDPRGPTSTS